MWIRHFLLSFTSVCNTQQGLPDTVPNHGTSRGEWTVIDSGTVWCLYLDPKYSHDTIRCGIFTCAQKLTREPAKSNAWHQKWKNKLGRNDPWWQSGRKKWNYGEGFVKQVGFKPVVKDSRNYRWAEWWNKTGRSDGWRNMWVGNRGTGARMRFIKISKQLCHMSSRPTQVGNALFEPHCSVSSDTLQPV